MEKGLTRAVFFGFTIAKETVKLCISNVVVSVVDFGAHGTHAHSINHSAGVAVIPVLIHEFFLRNDESASTCKTKLNKY